jgi:DNA replication licensing factor MCM4
VSLFAFDDLVDTVRPGDRIEVSISDLICSHFALLALLTVLMAVVQVTGIYRALPRRVTSHMRTLKAIYRTYIDAIHFR